MLKGEDIVYIANDWFCENKTSSHHIAELLADNNRILYVEAAGQRAPKATARDIKKIFNKLRKAWKNPVKIHPNIYLYSPLIIPVHKFAIIRRINGIILKVMMQWACSRVEFEKPIIWIFLPHYSLVVDAIPAKCIIYYCADEYSAHPNVDSEILEEMEQHFLKKVDIVFAVSENLLEKKRKIHSNVFLSLHGVDVEHFMKALDETTEIPKDIAKLSRPIIGFFGLIEKWIDLDLIRFLASKRKDLSFVLIGRIAQDASILENCGNVHLLGHRPYAILPNYLKAFDICILPYKLNAQVFHSNPKKFREYLAAGKPVVSVRVREVERYKDMAYIAESYDEFLECIDRALKRDRPDMKRARVEAMKKESWQARVDTICETINGYLERIKY